VGEVRKRVVLAFFGCFIMTSSPPQRAKFWLEVWLYFRLEYEALEALIDFLAGQKTPNR